LRRYRPYYILFFILLVGSTFITSRLFVDLLYAPKYYFFVVALFAVFMVLPWAAKRVTLPRISRAITPLLIGGILYMALGLVPFNPHWISVVALILFTLLCFQLSRKRQGWLELLYGLVAFGAGLAGWGLLQYSGWLPAISGFPMTVAFNNPAGFAITLALIFPVGLYLILQEGSRLYVRCLAGAAVVVILAAIILCGSRTAMLSVIVSSGILLALQTGLGHRLKTYIPRWKGAVSLIFMALLIGAVAGLYQLNRASANGRLLIWRVSADMIADHPFLGCGPGCFQGQYMNYQAHFFAHHPNHPFHQLADNDIHSFNKFVLIAVEYGIIGLLFVLAFLFYLFRNIVRSKNPLKYLCIAGLAGFLAAACFSYPMRYISVWLLIVFYGAMGVETKRVMLSNRLWPLAGRVAMTGLAAACLLLTAWQVRAQLQWNTVAHHALEGNAKAALPQYAKLYPRLKHNPFFLYNYGAELATAEKYAESTAILNECEVRLTNYDMQLLLATNDKKTGKLKKAEQRYIHAANMIPDRFWPLYQLVKLYKKQHKAQEAHRVASHIVHKEVKIPSNTVASIKYRMNQFIDSTEVQAEGY
jgi:O-antigen ligase